MKAPIASSGGPKDFIIIGGNAAGLSAASKIKRLKPEANVLVFEQSPDASYSNCGIPYWLEGVVPGEERLIQITPEAFLAERGVQIFTGHRVTAIDAREQTIRVENTQTARSSSVGFSRLLIATGATPHRPAWAPAATNIFTIRSLEHGRRLARALHPQARHVAIIGSGPLGLELAAALRASGRLVTLLQRGPAVLSNYEAPISARVSEELLAQGITLYLETPATGFEQEGKQVRAVVTGGRPERIVADLFVLAMGIRPNVQLAAAAGIDLGATGAIKTDSRLRTNFSHIYAAGDCIEIPHLLTGKSAWLPLGPAANKQGRIAGENMAGAHVPYSGAMGTEAFKIFDLEVARTGLGATEAHSSFGPIETTTITAPDIAGYLPGRKSTTVTLLFARKSGRLLGGQIAGFHCAGKRIDVLATAIAAGMTVDDLATLDLSYAPPMAPVWDPLLVAANQAVKQRRASGRPTHL